MKLEKKDRERLYKAKGKVIAITWPQEAPRARGGKRYAIYGDADEKLFSIRLERSKRGSEMTRAWVRVDNDPIRILPGLTDEPERVHEDYEVILCTEATYRNRLLRAEHSGSGKLAEEYAVREQKRVSASA